MTTWFISGHLDLTQEEFEREYAPLIRQFAAQGDTFVVGDAPGCDAMAQVLLYSLGAKATIYHMLATPRFDMPFPLVGGFTSDNDRDAAMTMASDAEIAWVRPGRERSGTARNIKRRAALREKKGTQP